MSILKISAAFEKRLATIPTNISTAHENIPFTPVTGTPFQRVRLLPATPENPTLGDAYYREVGFFEIVLFYPLNTGRNLAQTKAEQIKAYFPRGLNISEAGINVVVPRTPTIATATQLDDRYVIPITVEYFAEIFA